MIVKNGGYEALHEFREHFAMDHLPGARLPGLDFADWRAHRAIVRDEQ